MRSFIRLAAAVLVIPCTAAFPDDGDFPKTGVNYIAGPQSTSGQVGGGGAAGAQGGGAPAGGAAAPGVGGQFNADPRAGSNDGVGPGVVGADESNQLGDRGPNGGGRGKRRWGGEGPGGGRSPDQNEDRDDKPDPAVELSLDDIKTNFDTVIQSYVDKRSADGVWDYRDKGGKVWHLEAASIESSGLHKTGQDVYTGRGTLRDAKTRGRLTFEFVVDFSGAWKVVSTKPVVPKKGKKS